MKHVFVETNFIIEVARPFPSREAESFLELQDSGAIQLHVPWCSVAEAKRKLSEIIGEDLGFTSAMMKFAARNHTTERFDKREIDKLQALAKASRAEAIRTKNARVDALAERMSVIFPTRSVVETTLELFDTRSLKPFDEMALGAVLSRASELHAAGERALFFCTLDKKDFRPSDQRPQLRAAYAARGLRFCSKFEL